MNKINSAADGKGPKTIIPSGTPYKSCEYCDFFEIQYADKGHRPLFNSKCYHPELIETHKGKGMAISWMEPFYWAQCTPEWCPFLGC